MLKEVPNEYITGQKEAQNDLQAKVFVLLSILMNLSSERFDQIVDFLLHGDLKNEK